MRLRYTVPPNVRYAFAYAWDESNDWTVEVEDAQHLFELVTQPNDANGPPFVVADDDPIMQVVDDDNTRAVALIYAGIVSLSALAAVRPADIPKIAEDAGTTQEALQQLIARAKEAVKAAGKDGDK